MSDNVINGETIQKIINQISKNYTYNFSNENKKVKNFFNTNELVNNMIKSSDSDIDEENKKKNQITIDSINQYKKNTKLWLYKNSSLNKEINSKIASIYEKTIKDYKIINNLINKQDVSLPNRDEILFLVGHPITKVLFPNEYNKLYSTQKNEFNAKMVNNTNFKYQLQEGNIDSINDNDISEEEQEVDYEEDYEIMNDNYDYDDEQENDN